MNRPMNVRTWFVRILAALALAVGVVAVSAAPAQAATCSSGNFCWYYLTNQGGSQGSQYNYTSGWIRMNTLVDDSRSSHNMQWSDSQCRNNRNPFVYLSDTYYSTRWVAHVGWYNNQKFNTFNPIDTNLGRLNMNDKFNDIWNLCA